MGTGLLLVDQPRTADLSHLEIDVDLNAVGDFYEGDAAGHTVVLAIEGHRSFDRAVASSLAFDVQFEGFWLGYTAYRERAYNVEGVGAGLHHLGRAECDVRVLVDIEKIFALKLTVLDAAASVDCGGLNSDVENAGGDVGRFKLERGVPLVEVANQSDRRLHIELDGAGFGSGLKDRDLRLGLYGQQAKDK